MGDSDSDAFQSADEGSETTHEVQNKVPNASGEPHLNLKQLSIEDKNEKDGEKEALFNSPQESKTRSSKLPSKTLGAKRISPLQTQTDKPNKPTRQRVTLRIEKQIQERNEKAMKLEKERLESLAKPNSLELLANTTKSEPKSSWGLGSWGTSLISSAASSVSTFSSQVGQGFETVMESVEASLGLPHPSELVDSLNKKDSKEELFFAPCGKIKQNENIEENNDEESSGRSYDTPKCVDFGNSDQKQLQPSEGGLFSDFSRFSKVLENTGNLVVQGSLDTLEMLGKKTMNLITEQDPTSKKTKLLLGPDSISLSEALQEVKDKNENFNHLDDQTKKISFVHYLDKFNSFKNLEFLESISQLAEGRVQEIQQNMLKEEREIVNEEYSLLKDTHKNVPSFEEISDDEFDHDFENLIKDHIANMNLPIVAKNLLDVHKRSRDAIEKCRIELDEDAHRNLQDIYAKSLERIAELVAASMEHYFHVGKVMYNSLALPNSELSQAESHYASLNKLAETLCNEVGIEALRFSQLLNRTEDSSEEQSKLNTLITDMFMEASNSYTYIQEGYFLLEPILHLEFLQQPVVLPH